MESKMDELISEIAGAELVMDWFGKWPSFHDAEIVSILLARAGESVLRIYPYCPQKPATVNFVFSDVTDVELQDFSHQNVIFDLNIETAVDQNGENAFRLTMYPCYGLAGRIDAKSLRVEVSPGKSPDAVSMW